MLNKAVGGLIGCALSAAASLALAVSVPEVGDAGDLPSSAQILPNLATITSISGTIDVPTDVDMFRFTVPSSMTVSFIVAATSTVDSQLILFNATGAGLWANDDMGTSLDAQITTSLASGIYYVAIGSWDRHPVNAANLPIFGDTTGVLLPPINSGAVTGWAGAGAIGSYTINVSTAPISEPETYVMMLAGLALLPVLRGRRRDPAIRPDSSVSTNLQ